MKSLWTNTFAVLFSVLSPYPYTTAICLIPILFYLGNKFLIPMISRVWTSPQVYIVLEPVMYILNPDISELSNRRLLLSLQSDRPSNRNKENLIKLI